MSDVPAADEASLSVDGNARYAAATAETVARIQVRDHVLEIFVTLSAALISFALSDIGRRGYYPVLLGYAALATALLSRQLRWQPAFPKLERYLDRNSPSLAAPTLHNRRSAW